MCNKLTLFVFAFLVLSVSLSQASEEKSLFEKGVRQLKEQQYDQAIDTFSRVIRINPQNPDAYKNRGVARMKRSQYDLAIQDFEQTRRMVPDLKGLYSNLGVAWYYKSEYSKAIENYNKEISLSPDSHFAYFNRAICWAELDELGKSLADIDKTLSLSPGFYLAHCLKGDLLVEMNQPNDAKKAYQAAINLDPEQEYARKQLAALETAPVMETEKQSPQDRDVSPGSGEAPALKADSPSFDTPEPSSSRTGSGEPGMAASAGGNEVNPTPDNRSETKAPPSMDTPPAIHREPNHGAVEKDVADQGNDEPLEGYAIQTGAYHVRANAEEMMATLSSKGYTPRMLTITRPSRVTWYLVRFGKYTGQDQARRSRDQFVDATGIDAIVRPMNRF